MFLNKWTAQLSCPGQIVEKAFDSEEELVAFLRGMERESKDRVLSTIIVIDPKWKEKLVALAEANGNSPA